MMKIRHPRITLKRTLVICALIVFLLAGTLGFCNLFVILRAKPYIVSELDDLTTAHVAIVLGAQVKEDGTLSDALADRVEAGIALYQAGKVEKLLMSGDHGQTSYDEVNKMRMYAIDRGVPPEDIFMDHAGFSTYDTMYRARDVFMVKSAIVVTQGYHLPRAVYTARTLGLEAIGFPADNHVLPSDNYRREILARAKSLLQLYVTRPDPRFLGDPIPITGDGRATND